MNTLESIARTICAAEGYDPEAQVLQFIPTLGALGRPVVRGDLMPQWQVYEPLVQAIITTLLETCPADDELKPYVEAVLRGDAVTPEEPEPQDIKDWRVFYGLKR